MGLNLSQDYMAKRCTDFELPYDAATGEYRKTLSGGETGGQDFGSAPGFMYSTILIRKPMKNSGIVWINVKMQFNNKVSSSSVVYDLEKKTSYITNALEIVEGPAYTGPLYDLNERNSGFDMANLHPDVAISLCN